ncbi:MAG: M15 family metallopeptidase [Bacilli bacterium]
MYTKRKLNYKLIFTIIVIIIAIAAGTIGIKKYIDYRNSNEFKLKQIGYNETEIKDITKLKDDQIKAILKKKYNRLNIKFIRQKYFITNNLDRYIKYYNNHKDDKISHIVSIVNVCADEDYYDKDTVKKTDISKKELMLVNKFNYLDENYAPDDIVKVSMQFAYGDNEIKKEVYEKFRSMYNDAKKEGLYLIITSSYRDYNFQKELWDSYANQKGDEWADSVSARAGYSEHQTGYTLDIVTYNANMSSFETTDEFKWLQDNAYKYGFILRYPKDKEDITGYSYESWHYRYVGKDVATKIKKLGITFDEYYAYFIEGK